MSAQRVSAAALLRAVAAPVPRPDPLAAVVALAAVLRFAALGRTPLNPFYDAAVRSMGTSGHAFLVGAYDPSARLAIDKPPVDLWLQVASTKAFGFTPLALLAPAAIGGTLAVAFLYDLLRTLLGTRVAVVGALALAVLPVAVITSRSDTMDSVMAALVVGALAVAARGLRAGRPSRIVLAGALVGAAFEVKLFEALIAFVPLALLWWLGAAGSRRARLAGLAGAVAACAAVGVAWLIALTVLVPAHERPWAFGAADGSAWSAVFVYDGWDRLAGHAPAAAAAADPGAASRVPAPPGPLRLLDGQDHLLPRLGAVLAVAWLVLLALALARAWGRVRLDRPARAGVVALGAWLAVGTVLFSVQHGLRPRYLEALDPAIAACLGMGAVLVAGAARGRWSRAAVTLPVAAVLTAALVTSAAAVAGHVQDSGAPGALPAPRLAALTRFLRARQGGARYEAASVAVAKAGPVIAHDGRPVLMLTGTAGRPLVGVRELARLVRAGEVRTALVGDRCVASAAAASPGCSAPARWIRAHGVDVSRAAGQPHGGFVYALGTSRPARRGTR